jgi:hypothetical protein
MSRLGVAGLCGLAALLGAGTPAAADLIRLRNGNELEGAVVEQTAQIVVVDVPGVGQVTLQAQEVLSVESRPLPPPDPPAASAEAASAASPAAAPPAPLRPTPKKSPAKPPAGAPAPVTAPRWPPRLDQPYPDLHLSDDRGNAFRLSSLKGKIILLQPVVMANIACQALSGAHRREVGPYGAVVPQKGLESIEHYLQTYAGVSLPHPDAYHVQVLTANLAGTLPTVEEGREWAHHFQLTADKHQVVLIADEALFRAGWWQGPPVPS